MNKQNLSEQAVIKQGRFFGATETKNSWRRNSGWVAVSTAVALVLAQGAARACSCGCFVFDVGTSSMFPEGQGGMVYLDYDFMDQKHNWSGTASAPSADNSDQEDRTHFMNVGIEYMFNRSWGIQAQVPYDNRLFKTISDTTGQLVTEHWSQLGDIRIQGVYTGFSPDLSTGLTFGLKLPTGSYTHNDANDDVDRDSQLGTGSTDLLLGAFHRGSVTKDNSVSWYAQVLLDLPALTQVQYRPGLEVDTAAGFYYNDLSLGRMRVTPVAQVIAAERMTDTGANASGGVNDPGPISSGYQRILLSPGIEFRLHPVSLYADVEIPVFQDFRGEQLAAAALFKVILSYHF